jgi:hypothetical protein
LDRRHQQTEEFVPLVRIRFTVVHQHVIGALDKGSRVSMVLDMLACRHRDHIFIEKNVCNQLDRYHREDCRDSVGTHKSTGSSGTSHQLSRDNTQREVLMQ